MKKQASVLLPSGGSNGSLNTIQAIESARGEQAPIIVIDRPGFLIAGGLPDDEDFVLDGAESWPWSLFREELGSGDAQAFIDTLLPTPRNGEREIYAHARQLLVDAISRLAARQDASHKELRRFILDAQIDELAALIVGTKSADRISKANRLQVDSIRAAAGEAVRALPTELASDSEEAVPSLSIRSLKPTQTVWLRSCRGHLAEAFAVLALRICNRTPRIVYTTQPVLLPAPLAALTARNQVSALLAKLTDAAIAAHTYAQRKVERLLVAELGTEDWTPPRPGWRPFSLGRAEMAPHFETMHVCFIGAPGTGKSVGICGLMDQVRDYAMPAIIYDSKGDFIRRYYEPSRGDVILSPVDERAPSWNLFDELSLSFDLDKVAAALIEEPKGGGEKYWIDNARIVLRDILTVLKSRGETTNAALYNAATKMPLVWEPTQEQLDTWLAEGQAQGLKEAQLTEHVASRRELHREMDLITLLKGTQSANLLDPRMGKTAPIIRSQLSSCMAAWAFLRDDGPRFSISEFVRAPGGRFLFLQSRSDMQSMLRPLITLWIELAANAQLALPANRPSHRLFFCIDELPGLQRLDALSKLMAEGRQYGSCVVTGIQLVSQLYARYGREDGQTMLGLHTTLVALRNQEITSTEYMSKAFGNRRMKVLNTNRTVSANDERDQVSYSEQRATEAVLIEGDFTSLKTLTAFVKSPDLPVVKLRFTPIPRRPEGTDAWRDADGVPLPYALREDVTFEAFVEAARKASESERELVKHAAGEPSFFDGLFEPADDAWTAEALLNPGDGTVAAIGAEAKKRARQEQVDPDTGEIFELADIE